MFFNLLTDLIVDQCVLRDSFLISHLLNFVDNEALNADFQFLNELDWYVLVPQLGLLHRLDSSALKEFIDFGLVQERQPEFFVGYVPLDLLGAVELLDVHVDVLVVEQAADVIHGARLVVLAHNGLLG